jgi:oligopeptide/dipeptide ABC transporter ATP-binding protein
LLASVLDPTRDTVPFAMEGSVPPAHAMPKGCRFHPRCPLAFDTCRVVEPALAPTPAGHDAACLLI